MSKKEPLGFDDDDATQGMDLEAYLRRKDREILPPSDMQPTDAEDLKTQTSQPPIVPPDKPSVAVAMADDSNPEPITDANLNVPELSETFSIEHRNKVTIKSRPIVGAGLDANGNVIEEKYIAESVEPLKYDEEWMKVFTESRTHAVTNMNPDQILERIDTLERNIFLIKAQQSGLKVSLEELLAATSSSERARLLEVGRRYKVKQERRGLAEPKVKRAKSEVTGKTISKTKVMKSIDTLQEMGLDRAAIQVKLEKSGQFDDATRAYLNKLFAGEATAQSTISNLSPKVMRSIDTLKELMMSRQAIEEKLKITDQLDDAAKAYLDRIFA